MTPVVVYLPLRLVSVANLREHWAKRSARANVHRNATRMCLTARLAPYREALRAIATTRPVVTVRLTRIGKRRLDGDNLQSAGKACRDGIADALGVDDADPRVTWVYEQSLAKEYGVRIEIRGETQSEASGGPRESTRRVNVRVGQSNGKATRS